MGGLTVKRYVNINVLNNLHDCHVVDLDLVVEADKEVLLLRLKGLLK
jgi:hypothetical protein